MKVSFITVLVGVMSMAWGFGSDISLIPQPKEVKVGKGAFVLKKGVSVGADVSQKGVKDVLDYFNEKISPAVGFELTKVVETGKGSVNFVLDEGMKGKAGVYALDVDSKRVTVRAKDATGLFYGVQTVLQLMPKEVKGSQVASGVRWEIPAVNIADEPAFAWRGMMLDVSRFWFDKESVKRFIDQLAEYKMNVFHWHLTDDQGWRLEVKSLPRLAEVGGFRVPRVGRIWSRERALPGEQATYGGYYTHEEVKEVLAYAAKRHVRVIPEIDVPGHSLATLVAYPEMACRTAPESVTSGDRFYGEIENTLCIGNDKTFEFMEKVLAEVAELFPDEYVHIGGDEAFKGFWGKCPKCKARMEKEGLKNVNELQSYFIRRMEKVLKAKGKKMIGWDEIHEGGLAPEATVMSWRGMQGGIDAAKAGHHVIMTPMKNCYLDLYQGEPSVEPDTYDMCRLRDSYAFSPIPEGVDPELILGGQGNLWTESVPHYRHAEYMAWPRGWALAEVLWANPDKGLWPSFVKNVERHFERADAGEVNYARSMYNAIVSSSLNDKKELVITLETEVPGLDIYYTFDNTTPDHFSPKYVSPMTVPKSATWIRVVTYREGKPIGAQITIPMDKLKK